MILPNFLPIAAGHVINLQRSGCGPRRRRPLLYAFALRPFYGFRFAAARSFCRAVKAITSPPEGEVIERRAFRSVNGHGLSLRVWRSMNSARSASVNIRRGLLAP